MEPTCTLYNEDCIRGMANRLAPNSVHLVITSIPFEELFTYSGKLEDVGNNGSTIDIRNGRFALNMRFVVEQLLRCVAPGCNVCIHIQQLLAYKNQHGFMGRRDFRGAMVDVFGAGGFHFIGEFVIPKNPQSMAQRLSLHSLQFKTGYARGACKLAPAPNDYVLIFQKPGECSVPVLCLQHPTNPRGWTTCNEWVKDAKGVWTHLHQDEGGIWDDIQEIDILDGHRAARETNEEKHVCPLQLEVIRRLVTLYTAPIDVHPDVLVLDPFMGIGSTAYVCLGGQTIEKRSVLDFGGPRNVVGFELKETYYDQSARNTEKARRLAAELLRPPQSAGLFSEA